MHLVDIEQITQDKVDDMLEHLDDAPFDISGILHHDELWSLAYESVIADLAAEAEAREKERKLEELYEQD